MMGQITSIAVFASSHSMFALQYFRASLTVPLYFERQVAKDSNSERKIPAIDRKIRNVKRSVIVTQIVLLISGLAYTAITVFRWFDSTDTKWDAKSLYVWSIRQNWAKDCKQLLIMSASINFVSLGAILTGILKIKRWIKIEVQGGRKWRCSKDGLFVVYLLSLLLLTLE